MECEGKAIRGVARVYPLQKGSEGWEVLAGFRAKAPMKGQLFVPGGKFKAKEDMFLAAIREMQEETQAKINQMGLCHFRRTYEETPDVDFEIDHLAIDGTRMNFQNNSTKEHRSMGWINVEELRQRQARKLERSVTIGLVAMELVEFLDFLAPRQNLDFATVTHQLQEHYAA